MADRSLHFDAVTVRRLYGIDHGLRVDAWCDGVNVVFGPNASGKTTLARVLCGLLWPGTLDDEHTRRLSGRFRLDGIPWRVDVDGRRVQYRRNGDESAAPSLPPAEHHARYHLYLHDLLRATDGADAFAERIMQEAVGGYDVDAAAEALGFQHVTRRGGQRKEQVEEARRALEQIRQTQRQLRQDQRRVDRLRDRLQAAREAQTRAEALQQAVDVAEAKQERREAVARREAFPDAMEHIRGNEMQRLQELRRQKRNARIRQSEAEQDIEEAEATLAESRLPETGLPDGFLERLRESVRALDDAEDEVADAERARAEAEREEDEAWSRLDLGTDRNAAAAIDAPAMQAVEAHVERAEALQGQLEGAERAEQLLAAREEVPRADTVRDGLQALIRWLQVPVPVDPGWVPVAVIGLGVFAVIAGGALLVTADDPPTAGGLILLGVGLLTVSAGFFLRERGSISGDQVRATHRQAFERMDVDAPETWTREAVVQRMQRLAAEWARAMFEETKADERDRLRSDREELRRKQKALEEQRTDIARQIGVSPDTSGSRTLRWIVERLSRWQTLHEKHRAKDAAVDAADAHREECRQAVAELVAPYGVDTVDDAADAHGALSTLEDAQQTVREVRQKRRDAQKRREDARASRREAEAALDALYDRVGLDEGDASTLEALCEQYEAYQQSVAEAQEAATRLATKRDHLQSLPGYESAMEEESVEVLQSRLDEAQATAAQADDLFAEIERIEQRVEDARAGRDLETAHAEYREARDALARKRRKDVEAAAGRVLADHIQARTRDRDLPDVFRRARALFADVTNGRYELRLDRSNRVFRATDHQTGRGMSLEALSSGTKVQLLLSVRMAFVEHQEGDTRLPLVLDETLANSDDVRATALIDAVSTIASRPSSGRQVIYLTAQHDEVAKWEAHLADSPVPYRQIVLADAERAPAPSGDGTVTAPTRPDVPTLPPDVTAHDDVPDVINVPSWTPRQPVEAVHLWYLVENLDLLRRALARGLATWGPWSFLTGSRSPSGTGGMNVSEDDRRRIDARAQAVDAWREAWQTGRGRPVDRASLEATDAVSDRFLDDVTRLAESHEGEASAVLDALRGGAVQYFRSEKIDALEVFFREEGYLDPRDPLSPEAMWRHVLAAVGPALDDEVITADDLQRLFARFRRQVEGISAPEAEEQREGARSSPAD